MQRPSFAEVEHKLAEARRWADSNFGSAQSVWLLQEGILVIRARERGPFNVLECEHIATTDGATTVRGDEWPSTWPPETTAEPDEPDESKADIVLMGVDFVSAREVYLDKVTGEFTYSGPKMSDEEKRTLLDRAFLGTTVRRFSSKTPNVCNLPKEKK